MSLPLWLCAVSDVSRNFLQRRTTTDWRKCSLLNCRLIKYSNSTRSELKPKQSRVNTRAHTETVESARRSRRCRASVQRAASAAAERRKRVDRPGHAHTRATADSPLALRSASVCVRAAPRLSATLAAKREDFRPKKPFLGNSRGAVQLQIGRNGKIRIISGSALVVRREAAAALVARQSADYLFSFCEPVCACAASRNPVLSSVFECVRKLFSVFLPTAASRCMRHNRVHATNGYAPIKNIPYVRKPPRRVRGRSARSKSIDARPALFRVRINRKIQRSRVCA